MLAAIPPALRVVSGDTVVTETLDAAGVDARGQERAGPPNPMNGPIFVEGAEPGDALRVEIIRIDPVRGTGWTRGALSANVVDPEAARDLPPRDRVHVADRPRGIHRAPREAGDGARGLGASDRADARLFWGRAAAGQAISSASSPGTAATWTTAASRRLYRELPGLRSRRSSPRRRPRGAGRRRDRGTGVETCFDVRCA